MKPYFDDGQIQIWCGDAREIMPLIVHANVIVTDPPYGVGMRAFSDDFDAVDSLLKTTAKLAAVFMSPRRVFELCDRLRSGWHFERILWMHKNADIAAPWRGWCMNSEAILLFSRPDAVWPQPVDYRPDVYTVGPWERSGHPNAKPISVVRDLVRRLSEGSVVLDPFMGSGTTLRAAKDLGLNAIGIEIEEKYCEIAVRRLAQQVLPLAV